MTPKQHHFLSKTFIQVAANSESLKKHASRHKLMNINFLACQTTFRQPYQSLRDSVCNQALGWVYSKDSMHRGKIKEKL